MTSCKYDLEKFQEYLENKVLVRIFPLPTEKIIKSKCQKPIKPRPQNVQQTTLNAKPLRGTNENIVNPVDGRKRVQMTGQWPYSVHGVLATKFNGVTCWGTGTLIGPNIVLTAAHNLYNYNSKAFPDIGSVQFLPAVNGRIFPLESVEMSHGFVSTNYVNQKKED